MRILPHSQRPIAILLVLASLLAPYAAQAAEATQPVIPVGLDCYRMWDQWPTQRIGARAYMRSTYDRKGGNEAADASHFLFQLADDDNVTLDLENPGVLYFARYNHWHGSPWHYVVDGKDHVVSESSTANPLKPANGSVFLPEAAFPSPLALTWATTMGADLSWVPIGFGKSFRMAYSRTHYGTGYYIYDQYVGGAPLSRPISTWDESAPVDQDVLSLLGKAGTDIAPQPDTPEGKKAGIVNHVGRVALLSPGETSTVLDMEGGSREIRAIEIYAPKSDAVALGHVHLVITWDGRDKPSVDAPLSLFFGAGTLYNRDNREYLVKALPVSVRYAGSWVHLTCYFPMPFYHSALVELRGGDTEVHDVRSNIRLQPLAAPPGTVGYFHATYRDHGLPEQGKDLVLLDTRSTEGGGNWSGSFVGTSFIFSDRAKLETLEGDPRFFFDDSRTPQGQGTGTEEWGGGGDYWGGLNMTLPLAGHPVGAKDAKSAKCDEDKIESAYRFLLADLMPFGKNALITLEHGGENETDEHYQSVTYWYGLPAASVVKTDTLKVGDPDDEKAHGYVSPDASAPYTFSSRYEVGVDHSKGPNPREYFPAESDSGRKTTGTSEFTLALDRKNLGVLLRRKLDYIFPNQRAEVFVANGDGQGAKWLPAGTWYLAGSNTCVYSHPDGELGKAQHIVETSNRRFRDDEFLISKDLTAGRDRIRVRVKFTPVNIPLFPGQPLAEQAWSEMRYDAYCFEMPDYKTDQ